MSPVPFHASVGSQQRQQCVTSYPGIRTPLAGLGRPGNADYMLVIVVERFDERM
jgi:hypothetical protein